jgi:hypothetical protein
VTLHGISHGRPGVPSVFRVIVSTPVSRRLGQELIQDRAALVSVLLQLREDLEGGAPASRSRRDPLDPDCSFEHIFSARVAGRIRTFRFSVNDARAPEHFFVEGVVIS